MQVITPDTLRVVKDDYLRDAGTRLAPLTLRNRALTLRRLAEYCDGAVEVDAAALNAFIQQHPGAAATRIDAYKRLRTFWLWGVEREMLPDLFAFVRRPGPARRSGRKPWTHKIEQMIADYPNSPLAPIGAEWLMTRRHRLANSTMDAYSLSLRKLMERCPDAMPTATELSITVWDNSLSLSSKSAIYRALKTFWRWGVQNKSLPDIWVADDIGQPNPRVIPRALSDAEIDLLLDTLADGSEEEAMISTILDTGVRVGELASLTRSSIRQRTLDVRGKIGDRSVPVSPHIRQMLWDLSGADGVIWRSRVTQRPLSIAGVQYRITRALRAADFDPPKAGPHMLRHTFALNYILGGGDVFSLQAILGHTTVNTTMIYVHMGATQSGDQHERYSPMANRLKKPEPEKLWLPPSAREGAPIC